MQMPHRTLASTAVLAVAATGALAQDNEISEDVVRLGVLTDFGGVYSHLAGDGSVAAVEMAVEDFGGEVLGHPIEVVSADHQNEADLGAAKAREWFDVGGVDMITELNNSGVALAVNQIAGEKGEIIFVNGSSDLELTNEVCTPHTVHYAYDGYALAQGTAKDLIQAGGESWFFLTVDFAFGTSLQKEVEKVIEANDGTVAGAVRHPLGTSDFSSSMLQAQGSGADVIALATTGPDAVSAANAAAEFGITDNQQIAGLLLWIQDVHSLGLEQGQGLRLTNAFYWDQDDETREFSNRFKERIGAMPNMGHAGDYSSALTYLKAVEAAGTDEPDAVMKQLKSMRISDMFAEDGYIREDGRSMHDMYVWEIKSPEESEGPWDYLKKVGTMSPDEAFQPLSESRCDFVTEEQASGDNQDSDAG